MATALIILRGVLAAALVSACFSSCSTSKPPEGGESYAVLAHANGREPNPVIVIPGILGTGLVDSRDAHIVWGSFGPGSVWHGSAEGRRSLALPMRQNAPLADINDDVRPGETLDRLSLFGGIGVDAYAKLLRALVIGGYRDEYRSRPNSPEHVTCFQFGYDWRKSNADNAVALDDFIKEKSRLVEADYYRRHGRHKVAKFDIVAHSMGGLLARYYLMYGKEQPARDGSTKPVTWAGTRNVKRLIQVGTPNGGSALAILEMKNGIRLSPMLPKFQSAVIGTFPSVYELLPRNEDHPVIDESNNSIDIYDPEVWRKYQWGLADPAQDNYLKQLLPDEPDPQKRRDIALGHLRKSLASAKAFHAALDCQCEMPSDLEMHIYYGDSVSTPGQLKVDQNGNISTSSAIPGDNTVTRHSALFSLPDEQPGPIPWTSTHAIHASHAALPVQPEFIHSLLPLLLNLPESPTVP